MTRRELRLTRSRVEALEVPIEASPRPVGLKLTFVVVPLIYICSLPVTLRWIPV